MFALLRLAVVQAATVCALAGIDARRAGGPIEAYRQALRRITPAARRPRRRRRILGCADGDGGLVPVAIWLAIRWSLLAQVVELEDRTAIGALRRSSFRLVRGRWLRVASLVNVGSALALAAGPFSVPC